MAMAELPQELIDEILPMLPVKSLKRFRCLSKPLCELIDSPHFIDSHLSKSSIRKLIYINPSRNKFNVCDVNFDLEEEEEVRLLERPVSSLKFAGHCNGLILLNRGQFIPALWNPSTRQYTDLPHCPAPATPIGSGLCYYESIDYYKAFRIVIVSHHLKFEVQFWIYGLKSNSWRKYPNWEFPYLLPDSANVVYPGIGYFTRTDGIIHWRFTAFSEKPDIVAFDVRNETFSILPQPVCSLKLGSERRFSTALHVLEGCLCISYLSSVMMPLQADLYIRKKDGADQFSWTQLFSVTEPLFMDRIWFRKVQIFGYSKRGDKIMLDIGRDYLVFYDLKEKRFRKVEIDKDPYWLFPILCHESLVSVGGREHLLIDY